jgi:hypothetical protein
MARTLSRVHFSHTRRVRPSTNSVDQPSGFSCSDVRPHNSQLVTSQLERGRWTTGPAAAFYCAQDW